MLVRNINLVPLFAMPRSTILQNAVCSKISGVFSQAIQWFTYLFYRCSRKKLTAVPITSQPPIIAQVIPQPAQLRPLPELLRDPIAIMNLGEVQKRIREFDTELAEIQAMIREIQGRAPELRNGDDLAILEPGLEFAPERMAALRARLDRLQSTLIPRRHLLDFNRLTLADVNRALEELGVEINQEKDQLFRDGDHRERNQLILDQKFAILRFYQDRLAAMQQPAAPINARAPVQRILLPDFEEQCIAQYDLDVVNQMIASFDAWLRAAQEGFERQNGLPAERVDLPLKQAYEHCLQIADARFFALQARRQAPQIINEEPAEDELWVPIFQKPLEEYQLDEINKMGIAEVIGNLDGFDDWLATSNREAARIQALLPAERTADDEISLELHRDAVAISQDRARALRERYAHLRAIIVPEPIQQIFQALDRTQVDEQIDHRTQATDLYKNLLQLLDGDARREIQELLDKGYAELEILQTRLQLLINQAVWRQHGFVPAVAERPIQLNPIGPLQRHEIDLMELAAVRENLAGLIEWLGDSLRDMRRIEEIQANELSENDQLDLETHLGMIAMSLDRLRALRARLARLLGIIVSEPIRQRISGMDLAQVNEQIADCEQESDLYKDRLSELEEEERRREVQDLLDKGYAELALLLDRRQALMQHPN